jgi:hypothetical protein
MDSSLSAPITIKDPRVANAPRFLQRGAALLNDPRDVAFFPLMLTCAAIAGAGVALFFTSAPILLLAPLYWLAVFGLVMDRFTLMLHCTSHRQLFGKRYAALNYVIPWLLGPFFGQTPNSYFAHHMGMHHREENLADDLSSTMRFQRDRLSHWLRYYLTFMFVGLFQLSRYFYSRKQWKLFSRVLWGEGIYWTALAGLLFLRPLPTLVVFVVPLLIIRTGMMMGNWAQHSFVCRAEPANPYRASITCVNTRYNRRCFNDGYHALHHVKPRCHWSEHPIEFERAIAEYGRHDAIVFDGIDYFEVWGYLMFGRWEKLAERFVPLEGAPVRDREQVIAFLRERVAAHTPAPAPAAISVEAS